MSKIFGNKEMRILMLGLDAAGKTSILFFFFINILQFFSILEELQNVQKSFTLTCIFMQDVLKLILKFSLIFILNLFILISNISK